MNAQVQVWNKDKIQNLIATNNEAVVRAIKALYARQTEHEQSAHQTVEHNGRGFNSTDARFLTSVAQALPKYNDRMTPQQLQVARRMLPKYWRQLLEIAAENGAVIAMEKGRLVTRAGVANVEELEEDDDVIETPEPDVIAAQVGDGDGVLDGTW